MRRKRRRNYPDLDTFFDKSGVTATDFAARIRKSQSYISKVRHKAIEPSLADALRISEEAGVPLESLIKRPVELSGS